MSKRKKIEDVIADIEAVRERACMNVSAYIEKFACTILPHIRPRGGSTGCSPGSTFTNQ